VNTAQVLLAIRALSELARTLLVEHREATTAELDAVDLRAADAEERLRDAIRRAEAREARRADGSAGEARP
jgi:hypothetical protein